MIISIPQFFIIVVNLAAKIGASSVCLTCTSILTTCDCVAKELQNLQDEFLESRCSSNWLVLRLTIPALKWLPPNVFSTTQCTTLRQLDIRGGSNISELKSDVFRGLHQLRELKLFFPRVSRLEQGVFNSLDQLEFLEINGTRIDKLRRGSLVGLGNVNNLRLTNNYINELEAGVFQHTPKLKRLVHLHNKQTTLNNGTFLGLSELLELDISDVTQISIGAFAPFAQTLRSLSIRANSEITLNRIWNIFSGVFQALEQLKTLRLLNTRIMTHQLTDDVFDSLVALQDLDLEGNILPQINRSLFTSLGSLVKLSLRRCQLKCVYGRNFASLQALRKLDLSSNLLTYLPRDLLLGLNSMVELDISDNPIIRVQAGTFCGLPLLLSNKSTVQQLTKVINDTYEGHNITESCPRDFNPHRFLFVFDNRCISITLDLLTNSSSPSTKEPARTKSEHFLLLIIVAICVAFLIVAIVLIFAYRIWSKRKNKQLLDTQMTEAQEMEPVITSHGAVRGAFHGVKCARPESAQINSAVTNEAKPLLLNGTVAPQAVTTVAAIDTSLDASEHHIVGDIDGTIITTLAVV